MGGKGTGKGKRTQRPRKYKCKSSSDSSDTNHSSDSSDVVPVAAGGRQEQIVLSMLPPDALSHIQAFLYPCRCPLCDERSCARMGDLSTMQCCLPCLDVLRNAEMHVTEPMTVVRGEFYNPCDLGTDISSRALSASIADPFSV